jgi:ribonuclease E
MGIILRTAGQNRTKTENKRDFEYLLRVWEQVRDLTLKSTAPTLVYEEGSLTKRSIRDLYNKDIDEVIVAGERGYRDAKDFMHMLMPSHAKNVKHYRDSQPIFTRYGIESQLDAMFSPTVQLKSGGYIVINQTEALVAIDVNSGRATREHHIEDTATKTNLEAADEVARQLRLRDLAGLIVIDFIDMDESRNNRTVERRMKEALKHDRARIQVGRISHFGLLEMSRQRIRTSVLESSTEKCPYCGGSGHIRSVSSVALQLLRALEEQLLKGAMHNLIVRTRPEVALYVLNHKRAHLRALEDRFEISIVVNADDNFVGQMSYEITRGDQVHTLEAAKAIAARTEALPPTIDEEDAALDAEFADAEAEELAKEEGTEAHATDADDGLEARDADAEEQADGEDAGDGDRGRSRRRRRGRRGRGSRDRSLTSEDAEQPLHETANGEQDATADGAEISEAAGDNDDDHDSEDGLRDGNSRRRRRGRRGGRRNRERREQGDQATQDLQAPQHIEIGDGTSGTGHGEAMPPAAPDFLSAPLPPPVEPAVTPASAVEQVPAEQTVDEPVPTPEAAPAASAPPPRRRSTVREPAPRANAAADMPATVQVTPAIVSSSPVEDATAAVSSQSPAAPPKRGWWGKRLLGN